MKRNSTPGVHFILLTAFIVLITALSQHSFAQCAVVPGNLVLNPSFENGTANWTSSGGNFSVGNGAVVCGTYSGDFEITNPAANWVSQTIATDLPAGTVLNASVYSGTHDNSYWHEISIQFYDANWNWISSAWVDMDKSFYSLPNGPQLYNWTAIVPVGAKYTQAQFSGDGSWIKTDNWVVTVATPGTVALGNNVFIDRNGNGKKDDMDWGYDGATVTLYADNDDNGVADGPAVATTTTYGDGQYYFSNLAPGKYFVQLENVPGWMFKCPVNGGDPDNNIDNDNNGTIQNTSLAIIKGETINLTLGGEPGGSSYNGTYDFGFFKTNGLGDYVFLDANANGVQDAGENGISDVTVNLLNTSGTLLESTTTDANGYYAFYDPAVHGTYNYNIQFVTPSGYTPSPANQGSDDNKDSDPVSGTITNVNVPDGTWNNSLDAGFVPQPCDARVTNLFFNRLDGGADLPISNGATFSIAQLGSLYNLEAATNGTIGSIKFTISGPTPSSNIENFAAYTSPGSGAWTGAAGTYNVNLITYSAANAGGTQCHDTTITFNVTNICDPNDGTAGNGTLFCAPAPTCASGSFLWSQSINSSNGSPSIVRLVGGSTNAYTIPVASYPAAFAGPVTISITDVVSYDGYSTRNTVTQTNERWRMLFKKAGVVVHATAYTNDLPDMVNQGYWRGSLGSGINLPNGTDEIVIEHINVSGGTSGPGSVVPVSICISYTPNTASISNFVWHDLNKNGLQDAGEPGLSGKAVILKSGSTVIATQNTNANGEYYFGNLAAGTYTLEFTNIGGMQRALHGVGSNHNINSKANNVTGLATVTIAAGENNTTIDAGYQTASLLPVQDIVLTPRLSGSVVEVNWQTINEVNTSHFEVERSYNNIVFESLQTVYSLVQNGGNGAYRITDNSVLMSAGNAVYRIKAVDKDGKVSYSRVASLKLSKISNIVYGPNPFTDYFTINYPAQAAGKVTVTVFDLSGRRLLAKDFAVSRGTTSLTVNNLSTLAAGTYTVQVTEKGTSDTFNFRMIK